MREKNTSDRLKTIMKEKGLRQIDILNKATPFCKKYKVKLGRNDLSQYISGKVEPSQKKLTVLAETLEVSEAWLMGYDVPKKNEIFIDIKEMNKTGFKDETNNYIFDYLLGTELQKMFEQISKDINIPTEELKHIFFDSSSNEEKRLDYENLLTFFKNYFKNQKQKEKNEKNLY